MSKLYEVYHDQNMTPTENDQAVAVYIEKYRLGYYDSLISSDNRFQVFYNLSVLRTGLYSWYDFRQDSELLEIGAGFGALTGMFCEKCKSVTATERSAYRAQYIAKRWEQKENLSVYAGEWKEIHFENKFDYIILTGILERAGAGSRNRKDYAEYLQSVAKLLKPDGIILLAVENRYGLKYFCGAAEPHTKRSFDGINGYPHGTRGYSFSRKELESIIRDSRLGQYKFYYPLPDYKLPQLIYTDDYLPEKNLKERLLPYYVNEKHMIAAEEDLYNDVADNGVFSFFANSFLVECTVQGDLGDIIYAAVSTDRGERRGYATTIHKSYEVRKRPLFKAGVRNARELYGSIEDLKAHRIPVVEHRWENDIIRMPFIEAPTLSNYLKKLMPLNQECFQKILDELYQFILQSSEEAEAGCNELADYICDGKKKEEQIRIRALNWGPILKKTYMELIPLNCFYDERKQQFLFFDQEFVRNNYPAKYVLFRAIHYIYCFTPGAEGYLPKQVLLDKYDLSGTWNYYWEEEQRFLKEVRNQEVYHQFYQWTKLNRKEIEQNIKKLDSEEEKIANYRVSDKMKKIWKVEMDILKVIADICDRHGLEYFLLNGTLLGAVRHKGFIPWDDDLDIGMHRKDYDKFLEYAETELKEPYFLQNMWTENCFAGGLSRVRNSETTGIQERELGHGGNMGIWVDILPLDIYTQDEKKLNQKIEKLKYYYALQQAQVYGKELKQFADLKPIQWRIYKIIASVYSHHALCIKIDKALRLYTDENSDRVAFFTGYGKPRELNRSDFETVDFLEFEHQKLPVPVGYKNYLFAALGKDYMKYPPEEERKPKHRGIFDPERPYTEYLEKLTGMFDHIKGKKIILFGAGLMFDDYMKKWGSRYRPVFTVDNDESKWGRYRQGIEIKDPEAILEIPVEKRRLIICSYYYKEIQAQLEDMGISDYQVYVQHLEWILKMEETVEN